VGTSGDGTWQDRGVLSLVLRLVVNAVGLWLASALVDGIELTGTSTGAQVGTLAAVALIFGLVNALIRPVVRLVALPLYVLTLGLITFVINALMLMLTGWIAQAADLAFTVEGFGAALLGALVVSAVSLAVSLLVHQ
jgi:putative membrane protein